MVTRSIFCKKKVVIKITYDLHIHSCLSPCAEDDMTPATIAGFAKLNGIDIIAVADHNAADNLPAVSIACEAYGVKLLPAIEVNTAEEIHVLCYFSTVEKALAVSDILYKNLPAFPFDKNIWGRQLIMDTDDNIIGEKEKLLTGAVTLSLYDVVSLCEKFGGIAVPAHVDKDSYSLLSVLGFAPDDLPFELYELQRPAHTLERLLQSGRLPDSIVKENILTSSDAHCIAQISEYPKTLSEESPLRRLF